MRVAWPIICAFLALPACVLPAAADDRQTLPAASAAQAAPTGSRLLLQIDASGLVSAQVEQLRDDVRRMLRAEKIPLSGTVDVLPKGVQMRIPLDTARARAMAKLQELAQTSSNIPGVANTVAYIPAYGDAGQVTVTLTDDEITRNAQRTVEQSIAMLRRRIGLLGMAGAVVQRQGHDNILAEVPGVKNQQRFLDLILNPGILEFRLVAEKDAVAADFDLLLERADKNKIPVLKQAVISADDLVDAQPGLDPLSSAPIIKFRFNSRGRQQLAAVTTENVGRVLAIVLNGEVVSAPRIMEPITGGWGQISGQFTVTETNDMAMLMRSGALPAKLTVIERSGP